jgi:hypothetical protein
MSPQFLPRLLATCLVFSLWVVWKRSPIWSTTQSWVFLTPEWVHVQRWSPNGSIWNFLQPQPVSGFSRIAGIWASMSVGKKVVSQLDVPTILTPDPSHLSRFFLMGCEKEVNNLGGTSAEVVITVGAPGVEFCLPSHNEIHLLHTQCHTSLWRKRKKYGTFTTQKSDLLFWVEKKSARD